MIDIIINKKELVIIIFKIKKALSFDILLLALISILIIARFILVNQEIYNLVLISVNLLGILPVFISALKSLWNRKLNIDLMASIALLASIFANELESALFINLMLIFARLLDEYTENKTNKAIQSLLKLRPQTANKITANGEKIKVKTSEVKIGDHVYVGLGESVPVDGIIADGDCEVNLSSLTGESYPVAKYSEDEILSSSIVVSGSITVLVQKIGKDTAVEKMIKLVEDASKNKSEINRIGDLFAQYYILIIMILAALIFITTKNVSLVLSLILVVCADDLAVAIPITYIGGIRSAARHGIIIKGSRYLETLVKIDTIVFDKTGTLSTGKLVVDDIKFFVQDEIKLKAVLLSAVTHSTHPVSKAISKYLNDINVKVNITDVSEIKGYGIVFLYQNKKYYLGNNRFEDIKIQSNNAVAKLIKQQEENGFNVVVLARDSEIVSMVSLHDSPKQNAPVVIQKLKSLGIENFLMLTGDNEKVAKSVAEFAGITSYYSALLPEDKIKKIQELKNHGNVICMVGDGVNDAASLKLADVSIAMGGIGSDVAIESSDIVLTDDNLDRLIEAIKIAQFVNIVAGNNFVIWGISNTIGLIFVFMGVFNPMLAALYNLGTDFIPLLNSFRTFFIKRK